MSLETNLIVEAGKIRGGFERLKYESEKEQLNRLSCRSILVEIKSSLEKLKYYSLRVWDSRSQQATTDNIILVFIKSYGMNALKETIQRLCDSQISSVDSAIHSVDNTQYYRESDVRKNLGGLLVSLDSFLTALFNEYHNNLSYIEGIARIGELVALRPFGLNENWAVANCYLSAMEIAINKKRKELALEKEQDFADKFRELISVMETKGSKVSELEKELPQAFWKIRNSVVHGGYSPDQQELELVITWVKRIIVLLSR